MIAIDSSAEQIGAARARGLDARRGSAETLPFNEEFDAVFSNAVLHWVRDTPAVIASVHRALKPGGRFVAELGGAGCVQTVRMALIDAATRRGLDGAALDPWFFPTEADYRARLEAQGFEVRAITWFPRPTPLPGDIVDWLETFAQPFLGAVPDGERGAFLQEVRAAVQPALFDAGRGWSADYIAASLRRAQDALTAMQPIGIIGGIGPESTIDYYRAMIAAYRERRPDGSYPAILINSVDAAAMLGALGRGELDAVAEMMVLELERLARAGAGVALLAANSPHVVFDRVVARSPLPLVSIVEATRDHAQRLGVERLALFGTRYTMQGHFYQDVFEPRRSGDRGPGRGRADLHPR